MNLLIWITQLDMSNKPIAITIGDPAGIGPEIIAQAFLRAPKLTQGCFVVGDLATMRRAIKWVCKDQIPMMVALIDSPADALGMPPGCLPVWQVGDRVAPVPVGVLSAQAGKLAAECIVLATGMALSGEVAAIVTAPLNKAALSLAGEPHSNFPGHTEMLQALAATHAGMDTAQMPVRMMLANDELRVVLVSIHVSLRDSIAAVSFERVLETLRITHAALTPVLGRPPRIGVAGLNPHAGEGGLFGREEIDIIQPAIEAARQLGMLVQGPFAPDTVFMRARSQGQKLGEFDVVVAMYHDQGLIPVKYLGVDKGVNVTLGLPLVRTSPDHGTAFDIAGTGQADAASLIEAIRTARQMCNL
jgi:4-hydroxythreonine-4-phosphate dehydrogenase